MKLWLQVSSAAHLFNVTLCVGLFIINNQPGRPSIQVFLTVAVATAPVATEVVVVRVLLWLVAIIKL